MTSPVAAPLAGTVGIPLAVWSWGAGGAARCVVGAMARTLGRRARVQLCDSTTLSSVDRESYSLTFVG